MQKKPDDMALAGARPASKGFNVALRQGTKPPPAPAQRAVATSNDLLDVRFASKKTPGEHFHEERIGHGRPRRNAPTSHTLREHVCAAAQ
ncbi:MAG: hypothetical protein ABSA80_06595 [Terriglobales bacterium]